MCPSVQTVETLQKGYRHARGRALALAVFISVGEVIG